MGRRRVRKAASSRATPGSRTVDLNPAQVLGTPQFRAAAGADGNPSSGINTGTPADWMGPGNPLPPVAPQDIKGRRFDFPVSYNIEIEPKAFEPIGFRELRNLSYAYDVLRLVIETRKDQVEKLSWNIVPTKNVAGDPMTDLDDPVIGEITDFFDQPDKGDPNGDWGTWIRRVLEDMFVLDAVAIYQRRDEGGKLLSLEQIDGATIKRVIDDFGNTPAPPIVAYQEVLHGFPAINYTADELLYMPRNRVASRVYGLGPVEQVVMSVNIGIRRESSMLDYYQEGNIPQAIIGTPDTWTAQQIREFQQLWDDMLVGNTAVRRRGLFVPGGVAKTFQPTKEIELTNKTDEWLARVVCYAFSVPPTPFVTQVNRATAESAHDAAIEEGLAPVQNYIKRIVDYFIRRWWPGSKVEFAWRDDREVDPTAQMQVLTTYVGDGIMTINEAREQLGLAPDPDGGKLLVKTPAGYVPIGQSPTPAAAPAVAAGGVAPRPIEEAVPGTGGKGAQAAAKAAGPFRQTRKDWWNAPHRAHARAASRLAK